ncbi:FecR family protein [Alistipes sp. ZOR0009]|uniref:FecR family protein n=1 Tax=Alistipes sp. ZOR0009 TaxID=1339253 RepID=UPI000690C22F|nr:FecR family protein [Alistipes sp. ZOR0009]
MKIDEILLLQYLRGNTTPLEDAEVEKWYDESLDNKKLLEQLYYTVFIGDRLNDMASVDVEKSLKDFKTMLERRNRKSKQQKWWGSKVASVAALFVGIIVTSAFFLTMINRQSKYTVITDAGEQSQVCLPDGSKVWVNSSSVLTYTSSLFSSTRNVTLTGEAYFNVTKDKHSPFIVNSKGISTKVFGTEFNVKARLEDAIVSTTLYSGSVSVCLPNAVNGEYLLKPGNRIEVDTKTRTVALSSISGQKYPIWIRGKFHFEQTTLLEITLALEKYYGVKFVFNDSSLKTERFTCDFYKDEGLGKILSILKMTRSIDYIRKGKTVYISRPSK